MNKFINEKLGIVQFFTILCCLSSLVFASEQQTQKIFHDGRDRVFSIMYDGDHGINSYNKNITYAETQNLTEDVAIAQLALYFDAKTDLGQTFLVDTLSLPVSPKDINNTVQLRKNVIENLVNNTTMQEEINTLLLQGKDTEAVVMELMTNRNAALEKLKIPEDAWVIMKPWYIMKKNIGQNPWWNLANQAGQVAKTAGLGALTGKAAQDLYTNITTPNFKFIDPEKQKLLLHALYDQERIDTPPDKDATWSEWYWHKPEYKNVEYPQDMTQSQIDFDNTQKLSHLATTGGIFSHELNKSLLSSYSTAILGAMTYENAYSLYDDYQTGIKNRNLIHALHEFVIIAEKIDAICKKHGIQTQSNINAIKDAKGLAMIHGLKHPRYQDKQATAVLTAWVNTFVNEIYEQDIYLAPYFGLIAEMDAYNAIAIKMIDSAQTPNKFCFAEELHQEKPKFEAQGFWNTVVTNPIANNLSEDRNIILTGPNAGGKSTAIRSVLQNIVLSQTFGIATGESFALTPYDVIHSYLKITDDITKGLSRYASELKRAGDIVIRAKTLRHDEKFFFVLDELFTGTGGKDGEICAYEFVNNDLAPFSQQIQFIFATHFDKLKEIGTNNSAMFANYKIDAPTLNELGKLQYPFTLSKGINNVNIAQQMKREAGLSGNFNGLLSNLQDA